MHTDDAENKPSRLTGLDREIAIRAIAALARGTPVEAAYQILAGIEALDAGPSTPMVIWPTESSREQRAAWHEAEATYWRESAARYSAVLSQPGPAAQSADTGPTLEQTDAPTASAAATQPRSA